MGNKGQIQLSSTLGEWIFNLAKSPEVQSIVEVGTWWGLGSTYCIKKGLEARENPIREGYSIECVRERYVEACRNLEPMPESFFLLWGSVISYEELKGLEHKLSRKHKEWFEQDLKHIKKAPFIGNPMEGQVVDLCILDGGSFSGLFDFFRIGVNSKYLILDDTITFKHSKTRLYILSHNNWEVLVDDLQDRNGYMICRNKNLK